jgi:outer membrane biosynthesis protein TonB
MGLETAAVEAVRAWRFKPVVGLDGKAVDVVVPIQVTFRLY